MDFPNQTAANICGYAANGHEYALVGASKGLIIAEVTYPDVPVKLVQLPGPDNIWKEIKTYKHYAYVVSEGGQGVQIVDLSKLPNPNPAFKFYTGDGAIAGELNRIHALHIDTTAGYLYAYGSNLFNGGAVILDLKDPYNPVYAGNFSELGYIHDGWVDHDTLYAAHISSGTFSIVNMKDKTKPVVLGTQYTPNRFTHNTWMSRDRTTIFATDEVSNSYLSAYNIQDPEDIQFLDKIQAQPGSNSTVHNTHILGDYAVTSWYTSGVSVVDVSRPENLVQTGLYDVAPFSEDVGLSGCWGVYPYLPSGNLLASTFAFNGNVSSGQLWVLTPDYKKACYLEGKITNALTQNPVANALIEIVNGNAGSIDKSAADGNYKTGQATSGPIQIKISAAGFLPATATAILVPGGVTVLNVALQPESATTISGKVILKGTNTPIPYAKIALTGLFSYEIQADSIGNFTFSSLLHGKYDILAGAWGYGYDTITNQNFPNTRFYTFELDKGYRDDFALDYGWEVSGTSITGIWDRTIPIPGTIVDLFTGLSFQSAPDYDVPDDIGEQCYVTGNSSEYIDQVGKGTMILRSPLMDLTGYNKPVFNAALHLDTGAEPFKVIIENGMERRTLFLNFGSAYSWKTVTKNIKSFIAVTPKMRIIMECTNNGKYSYEAAVDAFRITEGGSVDTEEPDLGNSLEVHPNPFQDAALIYYNIPENEQGCILKVYDVLGRPVEAFPLFAGNDFVKVGQSLKNGAYFVRIEQNGKVSREVKIIKIE